MNKMIYQNYTARIEYDEEDGIFVGHIAGIRDIVGFHGVSVKELQTGFKEAVDDYLAACEKLGQTPNKPVSGKLMLRVPPEVHGAALIAAKLNGQSLNQWASVVLREAVHAHA